MPSTQDAADVSLSSTHLDAMRGAAALVVLLGHTRDLFFSALSGKVATSDRITIGNEAVMIFFVLSGYLVGGSVIKAFKRNKWSWKGYLIKRMTRLWVVLLPALLFGVALDHLGSRVFSSPTAIYAGPPQQSLVRPNLPSRLTVPVVVANAVFLQDIRFSTAGTNESLWSLANEFWYYIAFPVLLLSLRKKQKLWLRAVYLLALIGMGILVRRNVSLLFLIWVLGALLSLVPLKAPRGIAKILAGVLAVLLPIAFVVIRRAALPIYVAQWSVAILFSVLLYLALHQTERAREGLYRKISGFFSRISYTLYLVHLPLAILLCACINNPWHRWPKSPMNLVIVLALDVLLVIASYLFYLLFEANTEKVREMFFGHPVKERHLPTSV